MVARLAAREESGAIAIFPCAPLRATSLPFFLRVLRVLCGSIAFFSPAPRLPFDLLRVGSRAKSW